MADEIKGELGDNGKNIVAGKGNTQTTSDSHVTVNIPTPPPGHYGPNHPVRQYELSDVIVTLIGDPLTGRPGVINQLSVMGARLTSIDAQQTEASQERIEARKERLELLVEVRDVKSNQYPRIFQALIIAMAATLIVLLILVLVRMP